jgi:non-ribosomal peptide synthetase component F
VTNLVIGPDAMSALRDIARADRATLFSVLLGVFYVLLHRRTGQTDLAVSSVFANRTRREVQNTVGFLANMAILRTGLPIHGDFHDVVRSTHRTVVDAVANQAVPYRLLEPVHGGGAGDVVFQMVAEPDRIAGTGGVRGEVFVSHHLTSRFDLELALIPERGTLRAFFFSADDRFEAGFVGELLADYVSLASVLAADPAVPAVGAG